MGFKMNGYPSINRVYGVGVLTTDNDYYYSTVKTLNYTLTKSNVRLFSKVILNNYNIDENTEILISDNMKQGTDPMEIFMNIICNATKK